MPPLLIKHKHWIVLAVFVLLAFTAAITTLVKHRGEVDSISDEQKLARSLGIIRTSTPTGRKVLKVLFYGQSITASGWPNIVVAHWHQKYPNTIFVVENRALGGFSSELLERTTAQDIAEFYPDLIVFHVYGDHRAYERILRMFRAQTAADVILQTDHGEVMPDPPCAEGLRLTLHRNQGCVGVLWGHQRLWHDEMSYHKIPSFAKKYGMAVEPQRQWWRDYLTRTGISPSSLLVDDLHPNAKGKELIAEFFNHYFDHLVEHWNGEVEQNVVSISPSAVKHAGEQEVVPFEGNRLEILTNKPLTVWPAAAVDGGSPVNLDGCYQVTRSSSVESVPEWPAVRRITLVRNHRPEDWTATLTNMSSDEKSFDFAIKGSTTGDEGRGNSLNDFVSKSGTLKIEGQDWMLGPAYLLKHIQHRTPFEVNWSVRYVCGGNPELIDRGDGTVQYRYILATGIFNGKHTATISLPASSLADVIEFRSYQPPLREN